MPYEIKKSSQNERVVHKRIEDALNDLDQRVTGILGQVTGTFNGQGVVIPVGLDFIVPAPFPFTILGWKLFGDVTGSAALDIQKDTYANFPPTGADSIVASAPPTVTSAIKASSATLTGWQTSIAAGDILRFVISSCSGFKKLDVVLDIRRA